MIACGLKVFWGLATLVAIIGNAFPYLDLSQSLEVTSVLIKPPVSCQFLDTQCKSAAFYSTAPSCYSTPPGVDVGGYKPGSCAECEWLTASNKVNVEVKVQLGMSKFNITMPAMQCESGCKDAGAGDIGHIPMDSLSHFPLTVMINNNEDDPRGIPKEYQDDFIAQFKDTPALKSLGLPQDATAADLLQKIAQIIGYVISPWVAYFAVLVAICISPYGCNKSNEGDCACQCCGNPKCSAITMFVFGAINLAITALAMHGISNAAAGGGGISTGSGSGPAEAAELLLAAASSSTGNHKAGFCGAVATLLQTILSKAVIPIDIPTEFKGPGGVTLPEECTANVNFICIGMVEGWPTGGFGKNDTVVAFPGTCESSLPADLTKACHDTGSGLVIWVVSLTMVLLVSVGLCFKPIDGKVDDPHAYGSIA